MMKFTHVVTVASLAFLVLGTGLRAEMMMDDTMKAPDSMDQKVDSDDTMMQDNSTLMQPKAAVSDTVNAAVQKSEFSTFAAALKAADLSDTFQGQGPFTIFVPNNAAFDKLPAGTVENLLKPENKDKLREILLFHVIPGKVLSSDIKSGEVKTLNGKDLDIESKDGVVTVNGAKVINADIVGRNGVIHVIDTVILPQ